MMRPSSPPSYGSAGFADEGFAMDSPNASATLSPLRPTAKIDFSKFRTKMCRNVLMGIQCPFQDRCVFAHCEDDLRTAPEMPPSYESFITSATSDPAESPVPSRPNTPPAYPTRFRYDPYSVQGIIFQ